MAKEQMKILESFKKKIGRFDIFVPERIELS